MYEYIFVCFRYWMVSSQEKKQEYNLLGNTAAFPPNTQDEVVIYFRETFKYNFHYSSLIVMVLLLFKCS